MSFVFAHKTKYKKILIQYSLSISQWFFYKGKRKELYLIKMFTSLKYLPAPLLIAAEIRVIFADISSRGAEGLKINISKCENQSDCE